MFLLEINEAKLLYWLQMHGFVKGILIGLFAGLVALLVLFFVFQAKRLARIQKELARMKVSPAEVKDRFGKTYGVRIQAPCTAVLKESTTDTVCHIWPPKSDGAGGVSWKDSTLRMGEYELSMRSPDWMLKFLQDLQEAGALPAEFRTITHGEVPLVSLNKVPIMADIRQFFEPEVWEKYFAKYDEEVS